MAEQEYTLVFDGRDLGTVTQEDFDFPNLWGRYKLFPDVSAVRELQHVMDYIAFSVRSAPLYQEDRADEVSSEEEAQFLDLIETDAWQLRDATGKKHDILVPLFEPDEQITWRWNIKE